MSLTSSAIFTVEDAATVSVETQVIVQPAAGFGFGGRGRLIHPTLGVYDYPHTPNETVNVDGDICAGPLWSHAQTLGGASGGGVDVFWKGYPGDARIIERWTQGDVGAPINHLRALFTFYANTPDPATGQTILWHPNYANPFVYKVAIVAVRAGGEEYKIDRRLLSYGYAPSPVELELRVIGYAS